MTDLSRLLPEVDGDGVHWTLEAPGELNVNLVHLDAGHAIGEHVNDAVDVVIVVLAGRGRLTVEGRATALSAHVVAHVPRGSRRSVHADDGEGLSYVSVHRRRGPLGIRPARPAGPALAASPADEGGDPACWAHLFEDGDGEDEGPPG